MKYEVDSYIRQNPLWELMTSVVKGSKWTAHKVYRI